VKTPIKKLFKGLSAFFLSFLILAGFLLFPFSGNSCAYAENALLFDDVVEVACGIQYLAALKADGTVSLAKIIYSPELDTYEKSFVDFEDNDYRIPVDMDILRSEVSTWENIRSIGILPFDNFGHQNCEILIGLDVDGKIHAAFGFPEIIMGFFSENNIFTVQMDDWSDVVSFATCRRLLMGVRSDGTLCLTGNLDGAQEIKVLAENATGVASVQLAWSSMGPTVACLFQDGRVGLPVYEYGNGEDYIEDYAVNVLEYDCSMSNLAALQDDDTIVISGVSVPDCVGIKQVCCSGASLYVVIQNGDVCSLDPDKGLQETDFKCIDRLYCNHSGDRVYGLLGLTDNGSVVAEWWENAFTSNIDLSDWHDITDLFFPQEDITYVVGLNQNGNILLSGNVTAEVY